MTTKLRFQHLSYGNKFVRAIWNFAWLLTCRFTPRHFHFWRCLIARLFGAKIGKGVHIYPSAKIWGPWNLIMDDYSSLGYDVDCYSVDKIHIKRHAMVSQYSYLCTASHDYTDPILPLYKLPLITAPIVIGEKAWVTADVFIAPGVTIGDGAVVIARSSVFHDIEPWMVAAGNPAKPVKPHVLQSATGIDKY